MKRGVLIAVEGYNTQFIHDITETVGNKLKESISRIKVVDHSSINDNYFC